MGLILQILGIVFLLILLAVAVFVFRVWRDLKQSGGLYGSDYIKLLELLPPLKLELEKSDKQYWKSQSQLADDEQYLTQKGFHHGGYYFTQQHATAIQLSLWQHPRGIAVCLMEAEAQDPSGGALHYVCDMGVMLSQGGSVFVSNSPFATFLPRAEADPIYVHEHYQAPQLLAVLKQYLPEKTSIKPIKHLSEDFRMWFEAHSEWLWSREQLQSPALQETFAPLGITFTDELIDQLIDYAQDELHDLYSERIKKRLAKNPKMTAEQWENMRDKLVIIHEKTPLQTALDEIYNLLDDTHEDYHEQLENLRTQYQSARALFDHALEKFNLTARLKRIGSTQSPCGGDVYLLR